MSESINELVAALSQAQGQIALAARDASNPFYQSTYATLAAVRSVIQQPFAANNLAYIQAATAQGSSVTVTTVLAHASGQWIRESLTMTAKDENAQSIGSVLSYCRRYALSALAGVASDDDDAELATSHVLPTRAPSPRDPQLISKQQQRKLFAAAKSKGWPITALREMLLDGFNAHRSTDVTTAQFDQVLMRIDQGPPVAPADQPF